MTDDELMERGEPWHVRHKGFLVVGILGLFLGLAYMLFLPLFSAQQHITATSSTYAQATPAPGRVYSSQSGSGGWSGWSGQIPQGGAQPAQGAARGSSYDALLIRASASLRGTGAVQPGSLVEVLPDTLSLSHRYSVLAPEDQLTDMAKQVQKLCQDMPDRHCIVERLDLNNSRASISLRILREKLPQLRDFLETEGKMDSESTGATDQSAQLQDAETRLRQDRAYLAQLQRLQEQARGLAPLRDLSKEIAQIQGQIEQTEVRLLRLTRSVLYDAVQLTITPAPEMQPTPPTLSYKDAVAQSFERGLDDVLANLSAFSIAMALIVPWLLMATPPFLLVILYAVRVHRKEKEASARALQEAAEAALAAHEEKMQH